MKLDCVRALIIAWFQEIGLREQAQRGFPVARHALRTRTLTAFCPIPILKPRFHFEASSSMTNSYRSFFYFAFTYRFFFTEEGGPAMYEREVLQT
jgi:hypothetical protein